MSTRLISCRCAALALAALVLGGCGTDATAPTAAPTHTLTVFAAASLRTTFTSLGTLFESRHPSTTVRFNFAGSSDLASQLINGAPADLFAAADQSNMTKVVDSGLIGGAPALDSAPDSAPAPAPVDFATNTLTIVVPPDNPARITGFADLRRSGVAVVVCAPQVPCGAAAVKIEAATGVTLNPVSEEQSVTDVLNKVVAGEADAGMVYVTDAAAAGEKVHTIAFPESTSVVNRYRIAVLDGTAELDSAQAFQDLVTGPDGQAVLRAAGFAPAT